MNVVHNLSVAIGVAIVACVVSLFARSRDWVLWGLLSGVISFGLLMAWDAER